MTTSEIEARPKEKVERRDEATRPGAWFRPAVDIFETSDELLLLADLPGVAENALDVNLEGDELTIEGRIEPRSYDGLRPLHVEYGVGGFHRRFTLGESIDREGIKAELRHGVLALRLPKAERAKARRIEVKAV